MKKYSSTKLGKKCPKVVLVEVIVVLFLYVSFVLLAAYPVYLLFSYANTQKAILEPDCYVLINHDTPNTAYLPQAKALYEYITSSEAKLYTMYTYLERIYENGDRISNTYVTEDTFEQRRLTVHSGRAFEHEDFNFKTGDIIPIIVGCNLQNRYQLGQTYDMLSSGNGKAFKAKVIGALPKNSRYYGYMLHGSHLDNSCIVPISSDYVENYFGYADYSMTLFNSIIQADSPQVLTDIVAKAEEGRAFSLTFTKTDDYISNKKKAYVLTLFRRAGIAAIPVIVLLGIIFLQMKLIMRKRNLIESKLEKDRTEDV